ncbi:MAG TPA: three-Cys-motif partner protein TcmP [Terriglobia bacterium]|nr:three-Cys-motif partner protein TcmP [Terriglobia bacterium]
MRGRPQYDEIGYWSEIKLDILKKYAAAYSTILAAQHGPSLYHVYVDAFAGGGAHFSKTTQDFVLGSPLNALAVRPPFREYHLIDVAAAKISSLQKLIGPLHDVFLHEGDCNKILLEEVFPKVRYKDYRRGLCILDPYGLDLNWEVMLTAGQMKSIDLFLNFPIMDMNRNVLWRDAEAAAPDQIKRMTKFWGDESWRDIAYSSNQNLFGEPEKQPNEVVAEAFRNRLMDVAGFQRVPQPLPMRNSKGAILYYVFFASQKNTAEEIVLDIFKKYRKRGEK